MFIAIKSEMDSRPFLYPLMRCLQNYGSILVLTNNRTLERLVDEEDESGFRNITVLVDAADSADEICSNYSVQKEDYDFVLLDNLGSSEYDVCFLLVGLKVSPAFDDEIELILGDTDVRSSLIQFGAAKARHSRKEQKPKETPEERKERAAREKEEREARQAAEREERKAKGNKKREIPEGYDPAAKFHALLGDKSLRQKKAIQVPFPSMQDLEDFEAEHIFWDIDATLTQAIHAILEKDLAVEGNEFRKEVRRKDESSGSISAREAVR